MSRTGSAAPRATLPAGQAVVWVVVGWGSMLAWGSLTARFGLRPALVVSEAALVGPALVAMLAYGIPVRKGLALTSLSTGATVLSLVAGAVLWVTSYGLLETQYALWPPPSGYLEAFRLLHEALKPADPLDALVSILAIALMPALCEELLFRGVLLPALARRLSDGKAVLWSALLFGLIHFDLQFLTPYRVPFAMVVGLALGALRLRSGSLVPCILAHALLNTITFALAPLTDDPSGAPQQANLLRGALLLLAGAASSAPLLRRFPRRSDAA